MNATVTQDQPEKKGLNDLFARLRANPRIPMIIAAAAAIAIVIAMVLWAKQPDYRVLFNNLSNEDGGAIITQLTQMNIPYQFDDKSGAITVPAEKVYELRLRLAQQGLPKGGAVGFELLDQEKFGISQFSEQVNYQRALEGELSRTIETLGPVKNVRVHLAMPKPTLFVREQKSPTASVTLNLQPGRALDQGQVSAIVHMVSSSVAGLPPGNVTIVDQAGHLLTQSDNAGRDLNDAQLKYTTDVENRYQQRIEAILNPIVGNGNVHAQVTAQIDFNNREQTDEKYQPNNDPANQAIRSRQTNSSEQIGGQYPGGVPGALSNQPAPANSAPVTTPNNNNNQANGATANNNTANNASQTNSSEQIGGQYPGGVPGALSNQPAPANSAPVTTPNNNNNQANGATANNNTANNASQNNSSKSNVPSNTSNANTTNFEVDRTILHTKMNVGDVERLSVAVVVNYKADAAGKPIALSDAQIKQIENLTREAMGYSEKRGDSLNVVNSQFNDAAETGGDLPFWQQQSFIDELMQAGRWLLVLIVAWILYRKLIRPQLRRKAEQDKAIAEAMSVAQQNRDPEENAVSVKLSKDELDQERKSQNRMSAEVMSQRIREMSENDPRVVALVIRQWMKDEL